jgi:hypothetical protein
MSSHVCPIRRREKSLHVKPNSMAGIISWPSSHCPCRFLHPIVSARL